MFGAQFLVKITLVNFRGEMKRKSIQWIVFFCGLSIMSLGIALVTRGNLGTTPISTLPLVSAYLTHLTFGQTTFIINILFVGLQWLLLRKSVNWTILLQIPMTLAFSFLIDFSMGLTEWMQTDSYIKCLAISMLGNAVLGAGVALEVFSGAMVLPGEGLVLAVAKVTQKPFANLKILNDVTLVILAVLLSWAAFGELRGVREGTIISAVFVGIFVKLWLRLITKLTQTAPADNA